MRGWYCEEKLFASQSYGPKVNPPHKIMQHAQKKKLGQPVLGFSEIRRASFRKFDPLKCSWSSQSSFILLPLSYPYIHRFGLCPSSEWLYVFNIEKKIIFQIAFQFAFQPV